MAPPLDVHVEVPEPYEYKPTKIDDAGIMRDVGIGVGIAIGAIAILTFVIRRLRDTRLSMAAPLIDHEEVTLTGIVRARDKTLEAPLSGRACVAHHTRVTIVGEPGSSEGRGILGQVPAGHEGERTLLGQVPFELELREGARVQIDETLTFAPAPYRLPPNPKRERALLDSIGRADKHDRAGFDELALEPGRKVAIRGMLRIDLDPHARGERGYRDDAPKRMRLVANGDTPVTVIRIWDAS